MIGITRIKRESIFCLDTRIQELKELTSKQVLNEIEFDILHKLLNVLKNGIDEMAFESKRAAVRTLVKKVVRNGRNAHVIVFGVKDDEEKIYYRRMKIIYYFWCYVVQ